MMTTMNISLSSMLKAFIDAQVIQNGYGTISEYVRDLVRKEQDRVHLRQLLLDGAASPLEKGVDANYFNELRQYVQDYKVNGEN